MELFEIVAKQKEGVIEFNFEHLKSQVKLSMENYKNLIVVEEDLSTSKKLRANLRKLKKGIEDKRKQIKREYLSPYTIYEKQVKEITEFIDEAVDNIDSQIKAIEEQKKSLDELYQESENVAQNGYDGLIKRNYAMLGTKQQFEYLDTYLKAMKIEFEYEKVEQTKGE